MSPPRSNKPPALAFAAQIRFTEVQRRYLLLRAAVESLTVSEIVRRLVDEALAAEPPMTDESGHGAVPVAVVLEGMHADGVDELAELLEPWGPQEPVS